jgi:hypothetical protein
MRPTTVLTFLAASVAVLSRKDTTASHKMTRTKLNLQLFMLLQSRMLIQRELSDSVRTQYAGLRKL